MNAWIEIEPRTYVEVEWSFDTQTLRDLRKEALSRARFYQAEYRRARNGFYRRMGQAALRQAIDYRRQEHSARNQQQGEHE